MLWSPSKYVSTRLRPRSFAALQAISADASACDSGMVAVDDVRHAEAGGHFDLLPLVEEAEPLERKPQVVGDFMRRVDRRLGHEDGKTVARNACREHARCEALPDDLGDAHDHRVTHVHAEVLVQHVQAVDVDVDDAVVLLQCLWRQHDVGALLESRSRQQARRRVVRVQQDEGDAAPEQFDDAHLAQVEVRSLQGLEQHEHAVHALGAVHHRAGKNLVRDIRKWPGIVRRVGRHRLPVQLAPAEQLAMRARQDLRADTRRRVGCRAADGDVLVRDQECAESATEMVDATLDQHREVIRRIAALRLLLRRPEQQLEVAVTNDEAAPQVADVRLRRELALEALQRRTQESLHQRERPGIAARLAARQADAAEQLAGPVAQQEQVGNLLARQRFREASAHDAGFCEFGGLGVLLQGLQFDVVVVCAGPGRHAEAVVDDDGMRAWQQHLEQLPVRVERCAVQRLRRIGECFCGCSHRSQIRPLGNESDMEANDPADAGTKP